MRSQAPALLLLGLAVIGVSCRSRLATDSLMLSGDTGTSPDLTQAKDLTWQPLGDLAGPPSRKALFCDAADDEVTVDIGNMLDQEGSITIDFWFRSDRPGGAPSENEYILSVPDDRPDPWNRPMPPLSIGFNYLEGTPGISLMFVGSRPQCDEQDGTVIEFVPLVGAWHHFALQYGPAAIGDPYSGAVYLDGRRKRFLPVPPRGPCFMPRLLSLCRAVSGPEFLAGPGLRGAIDDFRISKVARYTGDSFVPGDPAVDDVTLLLLRFESLPIQDDGPLALPVTSRGDVQLTDVVHP